VASAQVKSSLLLAGLFARGETIISEPFPTRDHSERLLKAAGAALEVEGQTIKITGGRPLKPLAVVIPGDISAAAFFMVAGCIHPHANIILKNVNLNPTRTGIIDALKAMGGQITVIPRGESSGEPVGDIHVSSSKLHGVEIGGALIPRLIDEIPVLAVAAAVASGETLIRDAAELRVKESDRITRVAEELGKMGASIQALPDGFLIQGNGGGDLRGTIVDSHGDHRLGMALAIAALVADRPTMIRGAEAMAVSYPQFSSHMSILGVKVKEE
jgi:3-phosphoshikimate 1-carboxyvinyltransferase